MSEIRDRTIPALLEALAAKTPSPGGGATAALTGALGAAQLHMVAEYSAWEAGAPDPRARLKTLIAELAALADRDAEAYGAYARARKARKEDPAGFAHAQREIAAVPADLVERCLDAAALVSDILRRAPSWFACDASIAVGCLLTGAEGARALCAANEKALDGPGRDAYTARVRAAEARMERVRRDLEPLLLARLGSRSQ